MTAILPEMGSDAISPRLLSHQRGLNDFRKPGSPGFPNGRDMINIDSQQNGQRSAHSLPRNYRFHSPRGRRSLFFK
jgi:hypothetical protein